MRWTLGSLPPSSSPSGSIPTLASRAPPSRRPNLGPIPRAIHSRGLPHCRKTAQSRNNWASGGTLCPAAEPLFSHQRRNISHIRTLPEPMAQKVRIALDGMGGDFGPAVVVPGADIALARHPDTEFVLFGNEAAVRPLVDQRPRLQAS